MERLVAEICMKEEHFIKILSLMVRVRFVFYFLQGFLDYLIFFRNTQNTSKIVN